MAKKVKEMTPKKGLQIGRNGKIFKHGDIVPEKLTPPIDTKHLEEFHLPKMTPKKDMTLKVDKTEYKPGTPIADEHLNNINQEFVEPLAKTEDEQPQVE